MVEYRDGARRPASWWLRANDALLQSSDLW
jgi:hypothetical protein